MVKKKSTKSPQVNGIIKTLATKEYRQLLAEADTTIGKYRDIVARATGMSKDIIESEIQGIYLDNLRKVDEPVAFLKESMVGLMLKKQTSDLVREAIFKKALAKAEADNDIEEVQKLEMQMIDSLGVSDFDMKFHKVIQETIKAIEASKPRVVNVNTTMHDDNIIFDIGGDK